MKKSKRFNINAELLCAEKREGDGIDPRYLKKKNQKKSKDRHRDLRLCKQIFDSLSMIFSGVCKSELLSSVCIKSVDPYPDISRLCVSVYPISIDGDICPDEIMEVLNISKSFLRKEVAFSINRKRMPDLFFRIVSAEGWGGI